MTSPFDPYYRWLGIPPEEQPPHHYRLLGIGLFEQNTDVIESAADRQMAHVQTYKHGKYSALSQKLLNELAAAKLCLLNKEKKAAYDAQLRQRLASPQPTAATSTPPADLLPPQAVPLPAVGGSLPAPGAATTPVAVAQVAQAIPVAAGPAAAVVDVQSPLALRKMTRYARKRRRRLRTTVFLCLLLLAVLVAAVVILVMVLQGQTEPPANGTTAPARWRYPQAVAQAERGSARSAVPIRSCLGTVATGP
jgi:hypothetical protein